jgi:type IV secretory pathway TraG/TraD family ATPase VirD4
MRDVLAWAANPADETPQAILRDSRVGTGFWYGRLAAHAAADPRLVSNMWFGVSLALKCITHPKVLDACCPPPGAGFDPREFLANRGTLYLLGSSAQQAPVAPLVTALVEELVETAREVGMASAYDRLAPPLHLMLDEVANIAPLPSLPSLLSDGAGAGIPVTAVIQSPAQLQERWGDRAAQALWDNATCKILFGGSAYPDILEDISRLCGEYDQAYEVRTRGGFASAQSSTSIQLRKERVVPVQELYTLRPLTALLLARATRPIRLTIQPWWTRPDAHQLSADQTRLKADRPRSAPSP